MVDLLRSIKTISRRTFYSKALKQAPDGLLVGSVLASTVYWVGIFDYPILTAIIIFIVYILIRVVPSLKALIKGTSDIEACKTLDKHLNLKDRILSWYLLQREEGSNDKRTIIIKHQAEPVVSECDLRSVIATTLSFQERLKIILAILTLGLVFFFSAPQQPMHDSSAIISKINEAINDPQVAPEIREELINVKEAIKNQVSPEQIQGLADKALSTIEAFDSAVVSTSSGETVPEDSNPLSSLPPPTPTPTPTARMNGKNQTTQNKEQVDNQNTVPSKENQPPKEQPSKTNGAEKSQPVQAFPPPPTNSSTNSQSPQDAAPSSPKKDKAQESPKNDKGTNPKDQKESNRGQGDKGQPDKNQNDGTGEDQKDTENGQEKGKDGFRRKAQKEGKPDNQDGKTSSADGKKPDQPANKEGEQDKKKEGKEGKPEKDAKPSKQQEPGGAKSDSVMSLARAKEALNQLKTQTPDKETTKKADEKNEVGKSPGKSKPDETSEKSENAQKEKGVAYGGKDSELALELKEKKGKGDKPDLPSSIKYKDELITIEQSKIDRSQVGKSTGTRELPKGVPPKTSQEEIALPLRALTDESKKQRIPLEYEHLLRE